MLFGRWGARRQGMNSMAGHTDGGHAEATELVNDFARIAAQSHPVSASSM